MAQPSSQHRSLVALTALLILGIVAGLSLLSQHASPPTALSPSQVKSAAVPGTTLRLAGVVVESVRVNGIVHLKVADESSPDLAVLEVVNVGSQKLTFGPGVTIIAEGSTNDVGVFEASSFLTKAPTKAKS